MAFAGPVIAQPTILQKPTGAFAGPGEAIALSVEVAGTPPVSYQWQRNGIVLRGRTNSTLFLTNVAARHAGRYSVRIADQTGTTNAHFRLVVVSPPPRRLGTGPISSEGQQVSVPITLRAGGNENAVTFSLSFSNNAYSSPAFVLAPGGATSALDLSMAAEGLVGVSVNLPQGQTWKAGHHVIGNMLFTLAAGSNALEGSLAFGTNPVPIRFLDPYGRTLRRPRLHARVQPHYEYGTSPLLNPQTGLVEHTFLVGNPGARTSDINILVHGLGMDGSANRIGLYNAQAVLRGCPGGDCLFPVGLTDAVNYTGRGLRRPVVQLRNVRPGEIRQVTLEYYVADHSTTLEPKYTLYMAPRLICCGSAVSGVIQPVAKRPYAGPGNLVEFNTRVDHLYFLQYVDPPSTFANRGRVRTARPPLEGTGSRVQWVDKGPPKTLSAPQPGRLYRVLETPIITTSF